jgi:prepilin-type N-terminal cleavage/methylation domain-containing protein
MFVGGVSVIPGPGLSIAARKHALDGRVKPGFTPGRTTRICIRAMKSMTVHFTDRDPTRHRGRAFTLVELLVVIAIISILAALLLPTLVRSKDQAQRAKCMNNLKQVGYAIDMFADDHDQRLPGPIWQGVYDVYNDENERLPYYLATYLGLPAPAAQGRVAEVCVCPASALKNKPPLPNEALESLVRPISYLTSAEVTNGVTEPLTRPFGYPYSSPRYRLPNGPDEPPKKVTEIKGPSTAWAITDIDQENAFPGGLYYELLSEQKVHVTGRNQLFFDWHVAAVRE